MMADFDCQGNAKAYKFITSPSLHVVRRPTSTQHMASIWNFSVPATSPMYIYDSFTGDASTGWQMLCTASSSRCDENTAHLTSAPASVSLSFVGTGIAFYGNSTVSMTVTIELEDGTTPSQGPSSDQQLLAAFFNLQLGNHTVTLTAEPHSPADQLFFTEAVVSMELNSDALQPFSTYIDDLSPLIVYSPYWYSGPTYEGTPTPPGISNTTFSSCNVPNSPASLRFSGAAIFVYGPCYAPQDLHRLILEPGRLGIDLVRNVTTGQSNMGTHVIEGCLRFFATGLDPSVEQEFTMESLVSGMWVTLDYIQVVTFGGTAGPEPSASSGGLQPASTCTSCVPQATPSGTPNGTQTSPLGTSSGSLTRSAIIGGVIGGVAVIVVLFLAIWLYRRRTGPTPTTTPFLGPVAIDEDDPERRETKAEVVERFPEEKSRRFVDPSSTALLLSDHSQTSNALIPLPVYNPRERLRSSVNMDSVPSSPGHMMAETILLTPPTQGREATTHVSEVSISLTASTSPNQRASDGANRIPADSPSPPRTIRDRDANSEVYSVVSISRNHAASSSPRYRSSLAESHTSSSRAQLPNEPQDLAMLPSLAQISNDVNRILAELGRLNRRPAPDPDGEFGNTEDDYSVTAGTELPDYAST